MAKPELGTKRVCPTTGRKFYDLNKDPIVSPFTGESFPRSVFEPQPKAPSRAASEEEDDTPATGEAVELVSLDEADEAEAGKNLPADDDIELDDDIEEDETFLAEDEESDDDVSDLIDGDIADDEET
ncbi:MULTISPECIES: TIGR02300 family protein [unclassified Chelatococcus]|uniref:TIGR02300 family protein n=1 Tax=unclassified Chelatococcus TaxID=2638111 RepID=UPI001BCB7B1F|nr:TIGR02300 family protein [Chelatococcus sp.]MBS7696359.1 TIGR02300 family protein [Chelatococcus sp. YT9]MBX3556969.1 TIGR02300 family protein [Chelatococcus sp.]